MSRITELTTNARSTLEQFRAPMFENNKSDQDGWSLGRMNNMREVQCSTGACGSAVQYSAGVGS
jgi:hypothetical protein